VQNPKGKRKTGSNAAGLGSTFDGKGRSVLWEGVTLKLRPE
jgi:hypothetical protein